MIDASATTKAFPAIMAPCSEVRGELVSVLPVEGGAIVAAFACHCSECGGRKVVEVALPGELAPELRPLAGGSDRDRATWGKVHRPGAAGMTLCDDFPTADVMRAVWYGLLFLALLVLFLELSRAATLSISGSAVGNGSQLFQVVGENITALWNGTAWNVTGAF